MNDFDMSDEDLQQMYQEVILDASRHPHGKVAFAQNLANEEGTASGSSVVLATHAYCVPGQSHQFNPTCGDEVTVHVEVSEQDPQRIEHLVWDGQGCSISQASLSMMTDMVSGATVEDAMKLCGVFHQLMESRGAGLADEQSNDLLGDAVVFQGVAKYPMRIKCALLGWAGLQDALAKALSTAAQSSASSPTTEQTL